MQKGLAVALSPACHGSGMRQCCQPDGSWARPVPHISGTPVSQSMIPLLILRE